tara:strand:+ start:297 stop:1946 length:1650 start_codon:yes stop_codon:yes gene_type:complete
MPKPIRLFEGTPYSRLLTSYSQLDRKYDSRISRYASGLRKNGINARIIRNKKSTSLYIRPRIYNAPIPANTEKEAVIFPNTATRMLMGSNADTYGFSEQTKKALRTEIQNAMKPIGQARRGLLARTDGRSFSFNDMKDKYDISSDDIKAQARELDSFFKGVAEIESEILQDNDIKFDLGIQEVDDIEFKQKNGAYSSNLKESQWYTIENDERINSVFKSNEYKNLKENYFLESLKSYAKSRGQDVDGQISFVRADPENLKSNWYFFIDGKVKYTVSDDVVEVMKEEVDYDVKDYWREFFVGAIRTIGGSEHEAYVQAKGFRNVNDLQDEIDKLNFTKWDKWSINLYDTPKEVVETIVPPMIDLPDILDGSNEEIVEVADLSKQWATEITIKTNDTKGLVERLFVNSPQTASKPSEGIESITIENLKPLIRGEKGGIYAEINNKKVYLDKQLLRETAFNKKIDWIKPRLSHRKYNRTRNKIASYVYDEMEKGHQPNTLQIQEHLNDSMRSPPVIEQVGNWLARDPRFKDAGFDKWPSRVKKWELNPPKGS